MSDLIHKLSEAVEGSRDLDALLYDTLFPRYTVDGHAPDGFPGRWPFAEGSAYDAEVLHVTTSLDAALALAERVLPWACVGLAQSAPGQWEAWVGARGPFAPRHPTPALALCIAILKAKQEKDQ